jgi:hypothetical protein
MSRRLVLAAAQLGPIQKAEGRDVAVARMVALMEKAARRGAEVVVFPELALTTFFPDTGLGRQLQMAARLISARQRLGLKRQCFFASIGGFVKQYQVELSSTKMRAANITLMEVMTAVQNANLNVGGKTVEENGAEFVLRGIGLVTGPEDLELVTVKADTEMDPVVIFPPPTVVRERGAVAEAASEKLPKTKFAPLYPVKAIFSVPCKFTALVRLKSSVNPIVSPSSGWRSANACPN